MHIIRNFNKFSAADKNWLFNNFGEINETIIIYQENYLADYIIKKFPTDLIIKTFNIPALVFKFVESFYPGNSKICLKLFHSCLESKPVEFIFIMLAQQLKYLFWVKIDSSNIPQPSWKIIKYENQSKKFKSGLLRLLLAIFSSIDIEVKKSKTNLTNELDLIILTYLK